VIGCGESSALTAGSESMYDEHDGIVLADELPGMFPGRFSRQEFSR